MRLSGKYVRSQTQLVVLLWSKVHQQITIRLSRGVFICFDGKLRLVRIHLPRQRSELRCVPRLFEENYVMRVEADGPGEFVFRKEILCQIHHADVFVMRTSGKQRCHRLVGFVHQVVDDQ